MGAWHHAVARAEPIPLVLVDAQMPGIDGFELVKRIRSEPDTDALVVVMLSSVYDATASARAKALGISRILTKPVKRADRLSALRSSLLRPIGRICHQVVTRKGHRSAR